MSEYGIFWGNSLYEKAPLAGPIIENFLYEQDMLLIHAEEGIGKSVLVQQLMFDLTSANAFLGSFSIAKPMNVLWAQSEGSRGKHLDRIQDMKKCLKLDDKRWVHANTADICFDLREDAEKFFHLIDKPKIKYDVMIFDSLYGFVDGDLNNNKTAKDWTRNVRKIAGAYQAAIIVLSHTGKDCYSNDGQKIDKGKKNVYGARHWAAFFSQIYHFSAKNGIHTMECGKDRDGNSIKKIQMKMIVPQTDSQERLMFEAIDEGCEKDTNYRFQIESYIDKKEKVKFQELKQATTASEAYFYRILKQLEEEGKIDRLTENKTKWIIKKKEEK